MIRASKKGNKYIVKIRDIREYMQRTPEYKEIEAFSGPLTKYVQRDFLLFSSFGFITNYYFTYRDTRHKKTIIQFCQRKIRELEFNDAQIDRDNLILLWELLILLLQQNGVRIVFILQSLET
jgi:hypothetical protein